MPDCEGKACYTRVYKTRNSTVTTVGGVAVAALAPATKTAAEAAIKAKAERPKVVVCEAGCECVRNAMADTGWGVWRRRAVNTVINVGGVDQPVVGTIERCSKKTEQGDCEDPNELTTFEPGEWNGDALVAVARPPSAKRGGSKNRRG